MQKRKKSSIRSSSRELDNSKSLKLQKKVTASPKRKVTELIASSTRKKKSDSGIDRKQTKSVKLPRDRNTGLHLSNNENHAFLANLTVHCDKDQSSIKDAERIPETIFSSACHHSKDATVEIPRKVSLSEKLSGEELANNYDVDGTVSQLPLSSHLGTKVLMYAEMKTTNTLTFPCEKNVEAVDTSYEVLHMNKNHCLSAVVGSNNDNSSCCDEYSALENLSPEVSTIYLSVQNSKLECVDEQSQDTMSTDGCAEQDECDDSDEFDPYLFIKELPDLSAVVPRFRPMLLPKQTRSCPTTTLVLDLDETLVHSTFEPCQDADFTFTVNFNFQEHVIYVRCRPYLKYFLESVANMFETIIFTASQSIYAEQLLNVLDPRRKLFRHRVYRESCVYVEGNYLKDLSVLGRDLSQIMIIDNSPQAFGFQLDNGIPIESWFDNRKDRELISLLPFLESLVGVADVRPLIAQKFHLRDKVAAASCLSVGF